MTLMSRLAGRVAGLPPAVRPGRVTVDRDLQVPLDEGVSLLADRWHPAVGDDGPAPVLIAQSPYGRRKSGLIGRVLAERGFQVVIVSSRGTFGSGGTWTPFHNEPQDASRVVAWVQDQPWCCGDIALFGFSYLGSPLWSVAIDPPASLRAVTVAASSSRFRDAFYPGGSFGLESALHWTYRLENQELPSLARQAARMRTKSSMKRGYAATSLRAADQAVMGREVDYYRDWVEHHEGADWWWEPLDYRSRLGATVPASLVGGWYDLFLPSQLADYEALTAAGNDVRLSIGPWTHSARGMLFAWLREIVAWTSRHSAGVASPRPDADRVRLYVMGDDRWVDFAAWPPPSVPSSWYLQPDGALATDEPPAGNPDRFCYDPQDPTPSIGGANLSRYNSGPKDNRRIEARSDVLTYTSAPLTEPLTVIGTPAVTLHVGASNPNSDFYVRICDVSPLGRSTNLCDGIYRLKAPAGDMCPVETSVRLELTPTANTFRRGHRIRVQVASGAHPLYARNPGNGLPLGEAGPLIGSDQAVYHDPARASVVELPVVSLASASTGPS